MFYQTLFFFQYGGIYSYVQYQQSCCLYVGFGDVTGSSETTCSYEKVIFFLEEDRGLAQGARAVDRALVGGVVCWAKLVSNTELSKSKYENEEVLLLHRALVTQLTFLLGRIPFLTVRNISVCLLGPL